MEKFEKFLGEKFLDRLPKELRTKYFDFEPREYTDEKFCVDLLNEIRISHDKCKYYRDRVWKQFDFDLEGSLSIRNLESLPYIPAHIYKGSNNLFYDLKKVPEDEIVIYSMSSATSGDFSFVTVADFDQLQYNSIKLYNEFMNWKILKSAFGFNFSPNRAFMAIMAKIKLDNPEHKKKIGEKVRYFSMCMNKPSEYYHTVKYLIQPQLGKAALESLRTRKVRGAFKLNIAGMLEIIREVLKTGEYKNKKYDRISLGGSTLLMYKSIVEGMYEKNIQIDLAGKCQVTTGGGGWDGIKGEIKMPKPINKIKFLEAFQKSFNLNNSDFTDIYAFTESPVIFAAHWSEQYQDFIHHCPNHARILVRDSENLEPVGIGEEGLLEVITPYGVNGSINQAVLVDDVVELVSDIRCPECGYEGAAFRIYGRMEDAQGRSCASLFNWIY